MASPSHRHVRQMAQKRAGENDRQLEENERQLRDQELLVKEVQRQVVKTTVPVRGSKD